MSAVERAFLRYAFPCGEIAMSRGHFPQSVYEELEESLLRGQEIARERLERYFPAAVRRMREIADKEGVAMWSMDALHLYFLKYHSAYIDSGDGLMSAMLPVEKELCKCRIGVIAAIQDEPRIFTLEDGKKILGAYLPEAKTGDIVVSHRKFATEVLSRHEAEKFGFRG